MVLIIVFLSICLIVSIVINILLYKAAQIQLNKSQIYERWILEFKDDVLHIYERMKSIDNLQMFEKDDDVGSIFREMVDLISKLNSRTQEVEGEE